MCSSKPKKPKPAPPPAPPPPPPEESAASNQGAPKAPVDSTNSPTARKRKGRNSLRIDLNTGGATSGNGLNIPTG